MAILIVQLSDLHARTTENGISQKHEALRRAIAADAHGVTACVIAFCGDAAWGGKVEEFAAARKILTDIKAFVEQKLPGIPITIISVPGNHDCDLTKDPDQAARIALRKMVFGELPPESIVRVLLAPQQSYFQFSGEISSDCNGCLTQTSPFYSHVDLESSGHTIRFHLINTAWTSTLHETEDLRYPLSEFKPPTVPTADFAVTVLHHPYHWFLAPEVRRDLREKIEGNSDLVLSGHEHQNEFSSRAVDQGPNLSYIEGGVLQEIESPKSCSFNTIRIDLESQQRLVKRYTWSHDHFAVDGSPQEEPLMANSLRLDRTLRLTRQFEKRLDDLDDLVNHPRASEIRLSQIFSYPDLRRHDGKRTEPVDAAKGSAVIPAWVRSDQVFREINQQKYCLILGGDKAGKTSLARCLYSEMHRGGKAPLFLTGSDLSNSGSAAGLKRTIDKALKEQYQDLSPEKYAQLPDGFRILILDDLQDGPSDRAVRSRTLGDLMEQFDQIILVSSNEFYFEALSEYGSSPVELAQYMRYDICDFGQGRLHELAGRWVKLRNPDITGEELRVSVGELCEKVELVLETAGLPHTPWLLVVIIENAQAPEMASAKNGAYGKLYEAVITIALSKSKIRNPDIDGKYLYLARLAYRLHSQGEATISDNDARMFHEDHCREYDWTIDYAKTRDDLVAIRILRQDGDYISFRYKYLYCYFVANWLQRNIHKDVAKEEVRKLSQQLHHDLSSNVLVMLASLTQDPVVLNEMRSGTAALYAENGPASLADDVAKLNALDVPEHSMVLPATSPEMNRRLFREAQDEVRIRKGNEDHDGRLVTSAKKDAIDMSETGTTTLANKEIQKIRAAIRTMDILGQVLRNGATSQTAEEKLAIMEEIVMLGRRVLGHLYGFLQDIEGVIGSTQEVFYQVLAETDSTKHREARAATLGDESLEAPELKENARLLANRFWFALFSMATFGVIKRVGTAIAMRELDPTIKRLLDKDHTLANKLVGIEMRLNRREKHIPADEIVALHKGLTQDKNKMARGVLEMMALERLVLYETDFRDTNKICSELNIKKQPPEAYDPNRKKFTPGT